MRTPPPAAAWLPVVLAVLGPLALLLLATAWLSAADVAAPASTVNVRLADGFDFPVGWPEAVGYHKARGFRPNGHLGEDWDGDGGGNTDMGDPIYASGNGLVLLARDVRMGWGNVVIVRHGFRDPALNGALTAVDTLYGHLDTVGVHEGQSVTRGQQIATMGDNHGMYDAHLHFEVRKNLYIGMNRSAFARDFSNYHDPTGFVQSHRQLANSRGNGPIAINTFVPYGQTELLPPSDGAYELGALRSAAVVARPLGRSALDLQRARGRATGNKAFDKLNQDYRVDRYSDLRK